MLCLNLVLDGQSLPGVWKLRWMTIINSNCGLVIFTLAIINLPHEKVLRMTPDVNHSKSSFRYGSLTVGLEIAYFIPVIFPCFLPVVGSR
jgi:hypothetical protein